MSKFKFTELNQKSSKELFFLFYNSIWDCCSVDKIFKLLCDFGLFVWIQTDYKYLRFERIVEQMKQAQGITEQLKAENQMEWVARMNNM